MAPIRIAVDSAGGDYGTPVVVDGVLRARVQWPGAFEAVLCGDRADIAAALESLGASLSVDGISVEHCPDTIGPEDLPSRAWRKRERSSIVRCVSLQRDRQVDASVGAGDTGVLMAAANFILGRTEGAGRAALAATVPTTSGKPALLLDVGANVDCRAEHLLSFGEMGCQYMQRFYGLKRPRVALLNVGEEPTKGPRRVAEAAGLLQQYIPGYAGYVEGSQVLSGDADVIVCDGFVGNAMLKVCESFYALTESVLSGQPEVLSTVTQSMSILNAESYGAVPFLGIDGIVLKAHGNSTPHAIANAVGTTIDVVRRGVVPLSPTTSIRDHHQTYAAQQS